MTEEHKKALAEGRARAAMERGETENIIPADLPPGADRDEAIAMVADRNAEKIEENMSRDGIEAVDSGKFAQRDNEILRHVDEGSVPVTGAKSGYRLAWLTKADSSMSSGAVAAVRRMLSDARSVGYRPVQGDDHPTGQEFIGNDGATGTTLRGVGDTILHEIREEDYQSMMLRNRQRALRQGAVEENAVVWANQRLGQAGLPNTMHGAAGDFRTDPLMDRFAGPIGRPETLTSTWSEGDIRRGSARGPGGETLQPGFDTKIAR
jgi:hypothetical protein